METLIAFLKKMLKLDKAMHSIAGILIILVAWGPLGLRGFWPYLAVAIIGGLKEVLDAAGLGEFDLWDFVATCYPVAFIPFAAWLIALIGNLQGRSA